MDSKQAIFIYSFLFFLQVDNEYEDPADATAHRQTRKIVDAALKKAARFKRTATTSNGRANEKTPLLSTDESNPVQKKGDKTLALLNLANLMHM